MKKLVMCVSSFVVLLAASGLSAELPRTTLQIVTAAKSEVHVKPGDFVQLEHTYLIFQSPVKDAIAHSEHKTVSLVRTLKIHTPAHIGLDKETIGALFRAEVPGRSVIHLEIVEKNGHRTKMVCNVIVK